MIFPCPVHVFCPGGATGPNSLEFDSPLANLSSELPDQNTFTGLNFGWDHHVAPPLGSNWTRNSCLGVCDSTISQADADLCAARNNFQCIIDKDGWGTPPGIGPTGGPTSGPPLIPAPPGRTLQLQTNLNQSCTALCPDGLPFSFTVSAGTFIAENQLLANRMAFSRACQLAVINLICLSDLSTVACCNTPYSGQIKISGGTGPYNVTGDPPAGMNLAQSQDGKTIFVTGQTSATGNQQFTLMVTDANNNFQQKTFTLKVLCIGGSAGGGQVGAPYSAQFTGSGGDGGPYTFQSFAPPPPPGTIINPDGSMTGTPNQVGTFTFGVGIVDKNGNTCGTSFTVNIVGACNQAQTASQTCPGQPGISTSVTVPACTFSGALGTNQNFLNSEAIQSALQQLHDAQVNKGCLCPPPTMANPSGSQSGGMQVNCGNFWSTDTAPPGPIFLPAGPFDWVNWWEVNNGMVLHGSFHVFPTDGSGPSVLIFKV